MLYGTCNQQILLFAPPPHKKRNLILMLFLVPWKCFRTAINCHTASVCIRWLTLSLASISHLAAMSISMISVLPREEAQCIGARPYWNEGSGFYSNSGNSLAFNTRRSLNSVLHVWFTAAVYQSFDLLLLWISIFLSKDHQKRLWNSALWFL